VRALVAEPAGIEPHLIHLFPESIKERRTPSLPLDRLRHL
jgi:hypothetical protein